MRCVLQTDISNRYKRGINLESFHEVRSTLVEVKIQIY